MEVSTEEAQPTQDATAVFKQLESYEWDADEEFQSGLKAILGPDPRPEDAAKLTLRARCFYFARKFNTNVDYDAYAAWKEQSQANVPAASTELNGHGAAEIPPAGPKLSYQDIVEMIQNGKPIPGIKEIPDTVLEGQGTSSSKSARRKPWEKSTEVTVADAPVAEP